MNATDALDTLKEFDYRANLIFQTRFAQRDDLAKVGVTLTLVPEPGGTFTILTPGVDSDDVLAVYTRLRPFQLAREPIYHGKVMNAIGYLAQNESPEIRMAIKTLAKAWKQWPGKRWSIITADGSIDDVALAQAFLHGAGPHADREKVDLLRRVAHNEVVLQAVAAAARDGIALTQHTRHYARLVAPIIAE